MANEYFIMDDDGQQGPFTLDELVALEPDVHTKVLSLPDNSWQEACDLPELYDYFEAHGVYFPTAENLATFWWRLLAYLIDMVLLSITLAVLLNILAANGITFNINSYKYLLLLQLMLYAVLIAYNSVCEISRMQGSVGKKVCRLVVVDADGVKLTYFNALLRSVGKVISLFFYGLGFVSIFFSEHKQALHDYLAKTYVVKLD